MAHFTIDAPANRPNEGLLAGHAAALRSALRNWVCRRRVSRMVEAELNQYSEQELTELGISPADIKFVANDAAGR